MPAKTMIATYFSSTPRRRLMARLAPIVAVIAAVALLAGCGGSSSSNTSSSGGGGSSSGGAATVKAAQLSGYGTALVTGSGKSVYLLSTDPVGGEQVRRQLRQDVDSGDRQSGKPSAGSGIDSSKLSSFKRSDGTTQVLYNKHALYTYSGQGATSGQGQAADGGVWYLVSPSGDRDQEDPAGQRLLSRRWPVGAPVGGGAVRQVPDGADQQTDPMNQTAARRSATTRA